MTKTTNISNQEFQRIVEMIQAAQGRALAAVNTELDTFCTNVGKYVSQKVSPVATQLQQSDYQCNTKVSSPMTQLVIKQKIEERKSHESCVHWSWVKNYLKERSLKSYIIHLKS